MTLQQAKTNLRKFGKVTLRGVTISEVKALKGNWQQYLGLYRVYSRGEVVEETYDAVGITKAFTIARKYFQ